MDLDIQKYIIPTDQLDLRKVLSEWIWLVKDKSIIALTKMGDALLKDNNNYLYFLDTGNGSIELISKNYQDFQNNQLSSELLEEILLVNIVNEIEKHQILLNSNQVFSYKILPILGGEYSIENIFALDVYEHFSFTRDIHFQIKDLPDGTRFEIKVTE